MSIEQFPVKEKLATNLDSQIAWLVREMGYSRDKTKGYEEKLVRLSRKPEDSQSIFGFMDGYWHRFLQANEAIKELPNQNMASRALQANAKVVAGLSDKVAFALWLQSKADGEEKDPEWLLDTALNLVRDRVIQTKEQYTRDGLLAYNDQSFGDNPMGQAVLGLHESYSHDPYDIEKLKSTALKGASAGVLMWQAYAQSLGEQGYSVEMPKPGLSSGNIEEWH